MFECVQWKQAGSRFIGEWMDEKQMIILYPAGDVMAPNAKNR